MDLQIPIVLLSILLTGGLSLKCYKCESDPETGLCDRTTETCPSGITQCLTETVELSIVIGNSKLTQTYKGCADKCVPGTVQNTTEETVSTKCCATDLCNGSDGIYKGSFLLLLLPLFFYILFY
ncbi:urinary protein 1-like isoform X2 [Myxocyprinus asiaticus]|uniref:urinary protein 1-like isoform X1 n=1 Tax=Myxocyprinus asiaticus TaxID=70543 RepID=UPI002221A9E1|nr:urinary protein 1-like isoform X1 [Myxocyprinus asiaticus]XP_051533141.1 urinary protein 1-like isoform X2 [Myxocyprinus asiaticus]